MYPNLFLKTFWRMNFMPQVFVAMSFDSNYDKRWNEIYVPSISSLVYNGEPLKPFRVDISKTGETIITEIINGISHSQLILADVSVVGFDSKTNEYFRNGNVMYEVGLALACRNSTDVLIVRDDKKELLFDISTIPHVDLDFTNNETAITILRNALQDRLNEQSFINDARVQKAINTMTEFEALLLLFYSDRIPDKLVKNEMARMPHDFTERLIDKGLVVWSGRYGEEIKYKPTPLGLEVANKLKQI
ncbi:MAG: hypothetical protein APR62_05250 [Smithella sp. SDB]|nr:MAG: hypothetical protein APR62_05250 [Smithella sp. SDB]